MSEREAEAAQLAGLRARLYAPDSTAADRERYETFLARSPLPAQSQRSPEAGPDADAGAPAVVPAPVPGPRGGRRLGWSLAAVLLALAVGAAAGSAVSSRSAAPAPTPSTTLATPGPAPTAPAVPVPIAAAPITGSVTEQRAAAASLATALTLPNSDARAKALATIGADTGPHSDTAWSHAVGCSTYAGSGNVSIDGAASGFHTVAGETSARPTGTRFRLEMQLTRSADWSWVAYGTQTGDDVEILAVGAGAAASGPAQYAEFTERATTVVSAITISSNGTTPFLWQLESCTPN